MVCRELGGAVLLYNGSFFFFSSRRRHTRCSRDWSSDVCSSDLTGICPLHLRRHRQGIGCRCDGQMPVLGKGCHPLWICEIVLHAPWAPTVEIDRKSVV